MQYLYEESDYLNTPFECFWYDSRRNTFPVKPHWHYYTEALCISYGGIEVYVGEQHYILRQGDLILLPPERIHSIYTLDPDTDTRYAVIKFDLNRLQLTPHYAPKLRSIFSAGFRSDMPIYFPSSQLEPLDTCDSFAKCIHEMEHHIYGYDLLIQTELHQILLKLLRLWMDQGFRINQDMYVDDTRMDISTITAYIDEHLSHRLTVSEIAAACGMSYSYFAKKFPAVYGKSCKEYIEELRLFKVEQFLAFTDFDMNYIAQETGFSDCSHMIKAFKTARNITPKQFRLRHAFISPETPESLHAQSPEHSVPH